MGIELHVHQTHRQYTNGKAVLVVEGKTVGECLKDLCQKYPELKTQVFTAKGKLNPLYEIYVNAESAYPDELAAKVKDGDVIHISLLLSGG